MSKFVGNIMRQDKLIKRGLFLVLLLIASTVLGSKNRLQKKALELESLFEYHLAIELYQRDYDKTRSYISLEGLAFCYKRIKDYVRAEELFTQLLGTDAATLDTYLEIAEMQIANGKYSEAKQTLNEFSEKTKITPHAKILYQSCDSALLWRRQRSVFRVANERQLNSCYSEWGATISRDKLYFISDRIEEQPDCSENLTALKAGAYMGVFITSFDEDKWGAPFFAMSPLNKDNIHTGPLCFTKNDSMIYFTRTAQKSLTQHSRIGNENLNYKTANLEIYAVENFGNQRVIPFRLNNPKQYSVGYPTFNKKGNVIYFASDMPGGYGGFDLWSSTMRSDGTWGDPVNLGKEVNTEGDEVFPFLSEDETLYFSSNGHIGMGGLDIFYTQKRANNQWGKPINMKSPINSHADDFAFCFIDDGTRGFFASNRKGGRGGDDIYSFSKPKPEIPKDTTTIETTLKDSIPDVELTQIDSTEISEPIAPADSSIAQDSRIGKDRFWIVGLTVDRTIEQALPKMKVTLKNNTLNTVETRFSNADGTFVFSVPVGYIYTLSASSPHHISIPADDVDSKDEIPYSVLGVKLELEPLELNREYRLDRIGGLTYDFDKWEVTAVLEKELEKLVDFLQDNPTYVIEIGSHTDIRGNEAYNLNLSHLRAKAVVEYLLDMGIESDRLKWVGYGSHRLLIPNAKTEEEHRMNRRTTFTILSMD